MVSYACTVVVISRERISEGGLGLCCKYDTCQEQFVEW